MGPGTTPGRQLLRWAGIWFVSLAVLGLYLRGVYAWQWPLPVSLIHLLHAHSHTAYFGWAGLGLMGLTYEALPALSGRPLPETAALRLQLVLAPWVVGGAMVAFLYQGYGPISILFSALNELLWYLYLYIFWRQVRGVAVWRSPALTYLGLAGFFLFIATLGTYWIGMAEALHLGHPLARNSGIYLFLHAFGDGFVELATIGLWLAALEPVWFQSLRWLGPAAVLHGALLLPAGLRLLVPFGLPEPLALLGAATGALLILPQGLVLWLGWRVRHRIREQYPAAAPWLAVAWWSLALKALLQLGPLLPGWEFLALDRQLTVAYLHLKLLGFFTPAALALILVQSFAPARSDRRPAPPVRPGNGITAFIYALGTGGLLASLVGISVTARFFREGVMALHTAAALLNWLPLLAALPVLMLITRKPR